MLNYHNIAVDTDSCQVTYQGNDVCLHRQTYHLLLLFLKYPFRTWRYEEIAEALWDENHHPTHSTIRSHVKSLRQAFKKAGTVEQIIENVHGIGYRLNHAHECQQEQQQHLHREANQSLILNFTFSNGDFLVES